MEVSNITARWTRRLPREQYGHAEAELTAMATLLQSESVEEASRRLLAMLKAAVTEELRLGDKPAKAEEPAPAVDPKAEAKEAKAKKAEEKKAAKEEKKAAKEAEKAAKANGADIPDDAPKADTKGGVVPASDDVPDDDAKPNISTGGERTDPDVPDEDEDMSLGDFRSGIAKFVAGGMGSDQIKEIMAAHGAGRSSEVAPDKRELILGDLEVLADV